MKGKRGRYSSGGMAGGACSSVMKEAQERKKGGRIKKELGKVDGGKSRLRLDRPGRKRGGRVGADLNPLSSAAKSTASDKDDDDRGRYATGGRLTSEERKELPKSDFVFPGERKYPINDASHARNALARVSQFGSPAEKKRVRAAVHKKYPGIGQAS